VTALNVPLVAIATALTVLVFAFGVRRLIGLPRSILRVLAAGLIAFFVAPPIIRAMGGGTGSPVLELPSWGGPRPHGAEILNGSGRHRSGALAITNVIPRHCPHRE
jgi:hypothetical protein